MVSPSVLDLDQAFEPFRDGQLDDGRFDQAAILNKAFTLEELEAMDARIEAAQNGETKQLPHPTAANSFSNKDPPTPAPPTATRFSRSDPSGSGRDWR